MAGLRDILAGHRQLAATLARMLELARARQWGQLPALDAQCSTLAGELRELELPALSRTERARVAALAVRIRADHDELAGLVRPQFVDLMRRVGELPPGQDLPHDRMRAREFAHDPEKCAAGSTRSSAGHHAH